MCTAVPQPTHTQGWDTEGFALRLGTGQGWSVLATYLQHYIEYSSRPRKARKRNERYKDWERRHSL